MISTIRNHEDWDHSDRNEQRAISLLLDGQFQAIFDEGLCSYLPDDSLFDGLLEDYLGEYDDWYADLHGIKF